MKHVIRWTTAERALLIDKTASLMRTSNYKLLDAFRYAQSTALPVDRQRDLATLQVLGDLPKLVKQELNKIASYVAEQAIEPDSRALEIKPATLETLIQTIAQYIAQTVKDEVVKVVHELEHEFKVKRHNPEMEFVRRIAKPWISVIGLLPHQEQSIQKEFPDYDFHFMSTDYAIGAKPIEADAHLLMKNFIKHAVYNKYRDNPRHVLIDGGLTTLRTWLSTEGKKL